MINRASDLDYTNYLTIQAFTKYFEDKISLGEIPVEEKYMLAWEFIVDKKLMANGMALENGEEVRFYERHPKPADKRFKMSGFVLKHTRGCFKTESFKAYETVNKRNDVVAVVIEYAKYQGYPGELFKTGSELTLGLEDGKIVSAKIINMKGSAGNMDEETPIRISAKEIEEFYESLDEDQR